MKLNDYNQMMSYMRRPGFQDGTPQPTLINKMQTLKKAKGNLMPRSKVSILKMYMDEALKDGEITQEQHTEMLMPYFGELGEKVTEQIEVSDRDNFSEGTPRKIYKVIRPVTEVDRIQAANRGNPIPTDAKFKIQLPGSQLRGSESTTKMVYGKTKGELNKALKEAESIQYIKPSKPKEIIPDDKFLVKKSSGKIKENINKIEYEEVLGRKNSPDTFKPTGKTVTKYKPFIGPDKVTIPGQGANTLKEAENFVADYFEKNPKQIRVRDPEKDYISRDVRRQFEKNLQGRTIKFGAPKGYAAHHMLPLAGKVDVTDSDIAIISSKMNAELAQFDKPMNKLVNEAYALDFSKDGSLKRMNEINKELAEIVKKSETKLPKKYKRLIGFNKLTPVLDEFDAKGNQVFDIERIGADYKKSISGKKIGTPLRDKTTKDIVQQVMDAPKFKAVIIPGLEQIAEGIKNIPDDIAKKRIFTLGLKALGPLGTYIAVDDTFEKLKQGKSVAEALEYGLIGTNIIGSTKDVLDLSPEGREARSVIKQQDMREQIAQDFSGLDTDFDTPNIKSDMSRQEAEQKYEKAKKVVDMERASEEKILSNARAISMQGLTDLMLGKRFQPQQIPEQFLSTGGRAGYAEGTPSLKLYPRASGIQSEQEVGPGIKVSERDLNYGITGLLEGSKFFGGAEIDKGKVKVDVVTPEGNTLFKDTIGKKDVVNFILGMGDPEGKKFQIKADKDFENIQLILKGSFADGGRIGFADGPDDPSKRKFIKIGAGLMSLPFVGKYFKAAAPVAEKAVEVIRRGADGMPDFITDLITKVITLGKKSISGRRTDEIAETYQLDNYVVTKQGNKTTVTKRNQQGDMLEKDMEMELDYDPESGGYTYNEATARPDAEGKLKDVEEFIDEIDLEDMKKYTYNE